METIVKRYDPVSRRLIDVRFDICPIPPPQQVTYVFDATNNSQNPDFSLLNNIVFATGIPTNGPPPPVTFPSTTTFTMKIINAHHIGCCNYIYFETDSTPAYDFTGTTISISDVNSSYYTNISTDPTLLWIVPTGSWIPLTSNSIITLNLPSPRNSFDYIIIGNNCGYSSSINNFEATQGGTDYTYPNYGISSSLSWDPVYGATSYTLTVDCPECNQTYPPVIVSGGPTSAKIYYYDSNEPAEGTDNNGVYHRNTVTLTLHTPCESPTATAGINPCFLAGSLVEMADGSTKPIENVLVNDLVIGAFGEINTVLALHRPLLGTALMCNINNEHMTTNHHPHISVDKKFYCGNPDLVSRTTYGHLHKVIDAEGNIVDRMLHGLKKERIQKLTTGVELKTIKGSRLTKTLETCSMPEDTQLYNLVIGGSHTYHVDGYAVTGWPREDDFDYDNWIQLNTVCKK